MTGRIFKEIHPLARCKQNFLSYKNIVLSLYIYFSFLRRHFEFDFSGEDPQS